MTSELIKPQPILNPVEGQRVFTLMTSWLLGCNDVKKLGTIKVCKKSIWVVMDDTTRGRIRFDRLNWYSADLSDDLVKLLSLSHWKK